MYIYQLSYKILDIIWKLFFNMLFQQQHINIQIRYSIDTLRLMGKPVYGNVYTHIA